MMEDEAEPKQIWTHTNRSQIERKFGGSMEDIKDYWYKFLVISGHPN
jgi:hypothetical protein